MAIFRKITKEQYVGEISHINERLNDMFDSPIIDNWLLGELHKRLKILTKEYKDEFGVPKDWLLNACAMIKMFSGDIQGALIDSQSSLNESSGRANYLAHKIRGFIFLHMNNKELASKEFKSALKDIKELDKITRLLQSQGFIEGSDEDNYETEQLKELLEQTR